MSWQSFSIERCVYSRTFGSHYRRDKRLRSSGQIATAQRSCLVSFFSACLKYQASHSSRSHARAREPISRQHCDLYPVWSYTMGRLSHDADASRAHLLVATSSTWAPQEHALGNCKGARARCDGGSIFSMACAPIHVHPCIPAYILADMHT